MVKRKRTKWQTTIYETLHRKQTIEQHELSNDGGPCAPEWYTVPVPLVAPVVLL